jgi:hypothetical protein
MTAPVAVQSGPPIPLQLRRRRKESFCMIDDAGGNDEGSNGVMLTPNGELESCMCCAGPA